MPEFDWIDTCDVEVLRDATTVVTDIVRQMDLLATPMLIPASKRVPWVASWRQAEHLIEGRKRIIEMLLKRGVLRRASFLDGGTGFTPTPRGFTIEADEATVREAHARMGQRLSGRPTAAPQHSPLPPPRSSLPQNQQNALPTQVPTPPVPRRRDRVPQEFKRAFVKGAGEHSGRWAAALGLTALLLGFAYVAGWWPIAWAWVIGSFRK